MSSSTSSGADGMIGLSSRKVHTHYKDMDFAIQRFNNDVWIYEKGSHVFNKKHVWFDNTVVMVKVNKKRNKIEFYLGKDLVYTGKAGVNFPLHVDNSIYSPASYIKDIKWVG